MKEIKFESKLDQHGFNKIRVRLKTLKGKLVDVFYQYESFMDKKWVPIVRYDCAHRFFHRDILNPDGNKEKQEIIIENLKNASRYAEQDLKDRWE